MSQDLGKKGQNSVATPGSVFTRHRQLTAHFGKEEGEIRYIGDYVYTWVSSGVRLPVKGKSWDKSPAPAPDAAVNPNSLYGFASDQPVSPAALSQVLRSASAVQAAGRASGPGWTGTAYTFTASLPGGQTVTGTIDIDQKGQVRRLATLTTYRRITTDRTIVFSDFGTSARVTAPSAGQIMDTSTPYWNFFF